MHAMVDDGSDIKQSPMDPESSYAVVQLNPIVVPTSGQFHCIDLGSIGMRTNYIMHYIIDDWMPTRECSFPTIGPWTNKEGRRA